MAHAPERRRAGSQEIDGFFDLALDMLCIAGMDGYFKRLNPAWTEVLGFSCEELTAVPFLDFVHPDDVEVTNAESAKLASGVATISFENRYRCKDGTYRWLRWKVAPNPERDVLYAMASDITSRKAAEEGASRLAAIVQTAEDAIYSWSTQGIITSWNPGAEGMYGYRAEEVLGGPGSILIPGDRSLEFETMLSSALRGERLSQFETVRQAKDGHLLDVSTTICPIREPGGAIVGVSVIARDISARKRAERALLAQQQQTEQIVTNSQSMISVKDLHGRYLMANACFEEAFGVREADVIGETDELLDPVLAPVWRQNDLRAQRGALRLTEWADAADGRHVYDSVKFPMYDLDGELYATCGVSLDVTERQRATDAAAAARDAALSAAAAKSAFLSTMSHEIRTPLNAVIGMTGLLLDTQLEPEQREFAKTIAAGGDALLLVISDILDFSKLESGGLELERRPFALRDLVESAIDLLAAPAAAKGINLVADLDPACPWGAVGDVARLRQVLVNLLSNAVKFTERGDVIVTVGARPIDDDELELEVAVTDRGIGIPADRMDRLFRSFSQVDASTTRLYGGTGLGLAISQRLAEAMGGSVSVRSEEGAGSTFTARVTVGRCLVQPDLAMDDRDESAALGGRSALLIDDNPTTLRILELQLESWEVRCTTTRSAQGALALVAAGEHYDLAVLDMDVPEPDADRLAAALRELPAGRELPVILVTSLTSAHEACPRGPLAAVVRRPLKSRALRDTLVGVLGRGPRPGAVDEPLLLSQTPAPRTRGEAQRILLAEDNPINQRVAQLMLAKMGHRVTTVGNGQEAIEALALAAYDVVLMDIQMPVMDGLHAARLIRQRNPPGQPWVIAMTASVLIEDRNACAAAGMDDYLPKPVRAGDLEQALRAAASQAAAVA
jgi:PAS domain S-box-containing protein